MATSGVLRVSSIFRPNLFRGKVAIVTGGATGIGKAVAEELLYLEEENAAVMKFVDSAGCSVMIASRNEDNLKNAVTDFQGRILPEKEKDRATFVPCNIRKEDQVKALFRHTLEKHGRLDFLVNNGGGQFLSTADSISLKGWNAVVETNLTGTFLMCREAYQHWMEEHGGAIVNIIMENSRGFPLAAHSGAARAGVENLTRSLSIEWAASGVRVNALMPVSSAVCFLLSPGATYVSGATLNVDAAGQFYPAVTLEIPEHDRWPRHDSCSGDETKVPPEQ
ncbi:peroxisomal trans-2-enoyl-CoA reductase-like isoform X3 [Dermacentor andersoni]|uniref:peroxisomal trans-2-enoyl-CoA reductase-like isoform X3 n=1 Tax=Dermacentor andersoni TaxID=34620 RepID=UPI00241723A7|nr:peroxisomal trans-2-enoyl-CoA reductase-like isoform X3 [Dermacentor andersoni]